MVKRKKWDSKEDQVLMKILAKFSLPYKWDVVSHQMKKKGHKKSSKQCRERWMHQLDPNLKKEKWNKEEDKKIFQLHQQIGNHWKKISEHFPGRTDNQVKNNFFSLIRKSLRVACKVIGKVSNTKLINDIKPKVLSTFITQSLSLDIPKELNDNKEETKKQIKLSEFIQQFSQKKFAEIYTSISDQDKFVIEKCIEFLLDLNNNYSDTTSRVKKIKKIKQKNVSKRETISRHSESSKIKKNFSMSQVTEKRSSQDNNKNFVRSWTKINNDSLWDYFKDLQNSINNIRDNVVQKLKLIEYVNMLLEKVQDFQKKLAYANVQEIDQFVSKYSTNISKKILQKQPETILNMLGDNKFYRENFQNSMMKVHKQYLDTQSQNQVFQKVTQLKLSQDSFNNVGKQSEPLFQNDFNSNIGNDQISNLLDSRKRSCLEQGLFSQLANDSEIQKFKDDEKIANQKFLGVFNDMNSQAESNNQIQEVQFRNFNPTQFYYYYIFFILLMDQKLYLNQLSSIIFFLCISKTFNIIIPHTSININTLNKKQQLQFSTKKAFPKNPINKLTVYCKLNIFAILLYYLPSQNINKILVSII